jgi:hypothetical protein
MKILKTSTYNNLVDEKNRLSALADGWQQKHADLKIEYITLRENYKTALDLFNAERDKVEFLKKINETLQAQQPIRDEHGHFKAKVQLKKRE